MRQRAILRGRTICMAFTGVAPQWLPKQDSSKAVLFQVGASGNFRVFRTLAPGSYPVIRLNTTCPTNKQSKVQAGSTLFPELVFGRICFSG